jgi:hypothetical protein
MHASVIGIFLSSHQLTCHPPRWRPLQCQHLRMDQEARVQATGNRRASTKRLSLFELKRTLMRVPRRLMRRRSRGAQMGSESSSTMTRGVPKQVAKSGWMMW